MREAAALILAGLDPDTAPERITALLEAGIRAFLLPGTLMSEPERTGRIVETLRAAAEAARAGRILVAIGPGAAGFPSLGFEPHPLSLAALGKTSAARRAGKLLGLTAASLGIDLVMTPHVDSVFNPKNPSGVLDSFGDSPELASRLCPAFIEGINSGGAAACARGFPCSASRASAYSEAYPVAEVPAARICGLGSRQLGLAIDAGLSAILVGRMLVPSMEPAHLPAPSSRKIVEGRLRKELGFEGIVIAEAADAECDPVIATIAAAEAGCDLTVILDSAKALEAARGISDGMALGPAADEIVGRSLKRVANLLSRLSGRYDRRGFASIQKSLLRARVSKERMESCVVLKDEGMFDGSSSPSLILAFTPGTAALQERTVDAFLEQLRCDFPTAEIIRAASDPDPDTAASIADRIVQVAGLSIASSKASVLCCNAHFRPEQEALARIVAESFDRYSVIALKDPYDLAFFQGAQGLAAVFGFSLASAKAIQSLLSGRLKTRAVMPVNLIGKKPD